MKLDEKMRYPHPVLSEYSTDYVTGDFSADFTHRQTENEDLVIESEIRISNKDLRSLIAEKKASVGYFMVCRRTYFNHLQEAPLGRAEKFFDLSSLFGLVTLRPIVWTLSIVNDYQSPLIDNEFGDHIILPKGSVIAMGPEFRFSVDPKKFKPFETIFSLSVNEKVAPGMIDVDPYQRKIDISAEKNTHRSLADMRNVTFGKPVMLSSVYMPVVIDVIARLQGGDTTLRSQRWYQVFEAKCDDLGIDPADGSVSPLQLAQQLLAAPLLGTITAVEKAE